LTIFSAIEGIKQLLETINSKYNVKAKVASIRLGTTIATNALLERKGQPFALCITKGFKDLCHIGFQARPKIFELDIQIPKVLYDKVIEIDERVIPNDGSYKGIKSFGFH